jgi:hypothetical protein
MHSFCISYWNNQGLYSSTFGLKSTNPEFFKCTENSDIVILTETLCRENVAAMCPTNYSEIIVPSVKLRTARRGRDSGGILVWCKSELAEQHRSVVKTEKYHIWLKLHNIGLTETTTYLCAAYISQAESEYYQDDYFNNLYSDIRYFQAQGKVLL